ncbi:hypothetical protein OTK50_15020 [Bacillus sp. NEAU-CP5]|nr:MULTISPECIES: hypothetical protein [Bacillus]MCX3306506.1 hypothetical protein [Bacillus velezensis]MCX8441106.1 hypothetical protein [Bacillus sp. NEAU-CP5]ULH20525.1 hypothetical protein MF598_02115 [Bacillus velezensis]WJF81923.1 hypothetical protein QRA13_14425 [Bacillus velezensis]
MTATVWLKPECLKEYLQTESQLRYYAIAVLANPKQKNFPVVEEAE